MGNVLSYGLGKVIGLYVFILIHQTWSCKYIFMIALQKDKSNPAIIDELEKQLFFALLPSPHKNPKIRILKNENYFLWYHHFTHVYQNPQSYEVQFLRYRVRQTEFSAILGHFLPFDPPNNLKNQRFKQMKKGLKTLSFYTCIPQMMVIWCMVPETWSATDFFFVILDYFLPFYPPNNPENQNFEKLKKLLIDIIILHMCTINKNHVMYVSWDMKQDRQHFLSFWAIFCAFIPLTT